MACVKLMNSHGNLTGNGMMFLFIVELNVNQCASRILSLNLHPHDKKVHTQYTKKNNLTKFKEKKNARE